MVETFDFGKTNARLREERGSAKAFHGKLLYVDDLMEIADYETVRKLLFSNPIHYLEIFYEMIRREQWGELGAYAKELGVPCMELLIAKKDYAGIEQYVYDLFWRMSYVYMTDGNGRIRKESLSVTSRFPALFSLPCLKYNGLNGKYLPLWIPKNNEFLDPPERISGSIATCVAYIDECKEEILKKYLAKKEEDRVRKDEQEKIHIMTDGISKETALKDLKNGNTESVIITLCKVLEAKLRYIHHFNGSLYELCEKAADTKQTDTLLKQLV